MSASPNLLSVLLGRTPEGTVTIDAGSWGAEVLAPHGLARLVINDASISSLSPDGDALLVRGRTDAIGLPCDAILRLATISGALATTLRLEIDGATDIAELFGPGAQPKSFVADDEGFLALTDSVLSALPVTNAALTTGSSQGGTFSGDVQLEGTTLARYTPYPLSGMLRLTGGWSQITSTKPDDGYKAFTLYGVSQASVALPSFVSGYGLCITNTYIDEDVSPETPLSAAQFYVQLSGWGDPRLVMPLLCNDTHWAIGLQMTDPAPLSHGIDEIAAFLGAGSASLFTLPPGVDVFTDAAITGLQLGLTPDFDAGTLQLDYARIQVGSNNSWKPPVPLVNTVDKLGVSIVYYNSGELAATLYGDLQLGGSSDSAAAPSPTLDLHVAARLPDFNFAITQQQDQATDLQAFLKGVGFDVPWAGLTISDVNALVDLAERQFRAGLTLDGDIAISDQFALTSLAFAIDVAQRAISGHLQGLFTTTLTNPPVQFLVSAAYGSGGAGWTFSGGLASHSTLDIGMFTGALLGLNVPPWAKGYDLTALDLSYSTGDGSYGASGQLTKSFPLDDTVLGYPLALTAAASISGNVGRTALGWHDPAGTSSGFLSASFVISDLSVLLRAEFGDAADPTYTFAVTWGTVTAQAVLTDQPQGDGKSSDRVVTITLQGVTLGDIARRLVSWINPNIDFSLDPPWNVIGDIDLSGAALAIDLKTHGVTMTMDVGLDVGFASLTSVGLTYDRTVNPEGALRFQLCGEFLGQQYGPQNPLSWDATDAPPPVTPGAGNQLLDLSYLGIGQHIDIGDAGSIDVALANMESLFGPAAGGNPFDRAGHDLFNADRGWLIGLDATLLKFIGLKMVFDDPQFYGLLVGLSGEAAKSLNGLQLELTYKKVSGTVGVFHAEVALPVQYRQFNLGAVAVTMGIIGADVYTDGGFVIDIGFPANGDYSRAFTIEAGPFLGRGGFYFGVLQSGTADRLPAIGNGRFAPAVVAGMGLAAGVGRTFSEGPLSAGLYIQMEALFEGELAWFHPTDAAAPVELFYSCVAMAGIAGRMYGSVDFGIVSASLDVSLTATALVLVESYRETLVALAVKVSVSASIKIVFVRISFHFDMNVHAEFTFGKNTTTPWTLADNSAQAGLNGYLRSYAPSRRTPRDAIAWLRRYREAAQPASLTDDPYDLTWSGDACLFPQMGPHAGPGRIDVLVVPGLTEAEPLVAWPGRPAPEPVEADLQMVVTLVATTVAKTGGTDAPLDDLIRAMLRWGFTAIRQPAFGGGAVSVERLSHLNSLMKHERTAAAFAWTTLDTLFQMNLRFTFTADDANGDAHGAVLPMVPLFTRTDGDDDAVAVDYFDFNVVDPGYQDYLRSYFAELAAGDAAAVSRVRFQDDGDSFATIMFRDYHLMIAQSAIAAALKIATSWTEPLAVGESLADIAAKLPLIDVPYIWPDGGTLDQLAVAMGLSRAELLYLNPDLDPAILPRPGTPISVRVGPTPGTIAEANGDRLVFAATGTVAVGPIARQIVRGDTLAGIAGSQAALIAWLRQPAPDGIVERYRLLMPGALAPLSAWVYANTGRMAIAGLALALYPRLYPMAADAGSQTQQAIGAAASAIRNLNPNLGFNTAGDPTSALPATIRVPNAFGETASWPTLPGDTLHTLAASIALFCNPAIDAGFALFSQQFAAANPNAGAPVVLPPGQTLTIAPDETLATLAARLLLDPRSDAFAALVGSLAILNPLQMVSPDVSAPVSAGTTLTALAQNLALALDDLGARIGEQSNLFAACTALQIDHLASIDNDALVERVVAEAGDGIRGQVSRFMLAGLQVPWPQPQPDTSPTLASLYVLSGQQAALRRFRTVATGGYSVRLDLPPARTAAWIVAPGPAPFSVTAMLSETTLEAIAPAGTIAPTFVVNPRPASLTRPVSIDWDFSRRLLLQSAVPLPIDAGSQGPATLWPIPEALKTQAAQAKSPMSCDLATLPADNTSDVPQAVAGWCFGTQIDITVKATRVANTVEMIGAGVEQRGQLLALCQALAAEGGGSTLLIAYRPPQSAGVPPGLVVPSASLADILLIKTNLSTETRAAATARGGEADPPYATLAAPAAFATLAWECSIVGGGGFWLTIGASDADGIPAAAFDTDGQALLSIVALFGPFRSGNQVIEPYHNVVVVDDPISQAAQRLFATDPAAVPIAAATVDPGRVAFEAAVIEPAEPGPAATAPAPGDDRARAEQLFQLLGYRIQENETFNASPIGLPIGPHVDSMQQSRASGDVWHYNRTLPIYRFAKQRAAPEITGFPPASGDVYAGVTLVGDAPASASVELWLQDVYGNASHGAPGRPSPDNGGDPFAIDIPVMYVDPLIGVTQWPATQVAFSVTASPPPEPTTDPAVVIDVALRAATFWPSGNQTIRTAASSIGKHRDRYALAYYQLCQPDVRCTIDTALAGRGSETPTIDHSPLTKFTGSAFVYLDALASLSPPTCAAAGTTLADIVARYGVTYADLATANAATPISEMFVEASGRYAVPRLIPWRAGDSFATLTSGADPAVLGMPQNAAIPLRVGIELIRPPVTFVVTSGQPATFAEVSVLASCTVASLVRANIDRACLVPGHPFLARGVTIVSTWDDTLAHIVARFAQQGVQLTAAMLVNSDRTAAILRGEVLYDRYTTRPGDTLATNATGLKAQTTGPLNGDTIDLFDGGVSIYAGDIDATADARLGVTAFAQRYALTPEQVFAWWSGDALIAPSKLAIPGCAVMDTMAAPLLCTTAYRTHDLVGLAERHGHMTAEPIVGLNWDMPGWLSAGSTAGTLQIQHGDTPAKLAARHDPPLDITAMAALLVATPEALACDAVIMVPPGMIDTADGSDAQLATAAMLFGLDCATLVLANAGLCNWLKGGATVQLGGTTIVLPKDPDGTSSLSPNGLLTLFRASDPACTMTDLIAALERAPGIVAAGARVLLPPPPVTLRRALNPAASYDDAFIPIEVRITLARDPRLVCPLLAKGAAAQIISRISPAGDEREDTTGRTITHLQSFVARFEQALPRLRVATGRAQPDDTTQPRLTAVVFGSDGIAEVSVETGASFLALRPLYTQPMASSAATHGKGDGLQPEYENVDVEVWARQFLSDVDNFLDVPTATLAYTRNPAALADVVTAKAGLATSIAQGLNMVLATAEDLSPPPPSPELIAARATLEESLLRALGTAWDLDAMVQFPGTLRAPGASKPVRMPVVASAQFETGKSLILSGGKIATDASSDVFNLQIGNVPPMTSHVALDCALAVRQIEFDVSPPVDADGYRASSWLGLMRDPAAAGPLPGWSVATRPLVVPVPARGYPLPPQLLGQSARPTCPDTVDWRDTAAWTFAFTFQHVSTPQDQLSFGVTFNNGSASATPLVGATDLFDALARYQQQRRTIWSALTPGATSSDQTAAVGTFRDAVRSIAAAWAAHWSHDAVATRRREQYRIGSPPWSVDAAAAYVASFVTDDEDRLVALVVQRGEDCPVPAWPRITVTSGAESYDLRGMPGPDGTAYYGLSSTSTIVLGASITYAVALDAIPLAAFQDGCGAVMVIRNAQLLGPEQSPSQLEFIYHAPPAIFPYASEPQLTFDAPFSLGIWDPALTGAALQDVIHTLLNPLDGARAPGKIALLAHYALDPIAAALPMRTPIFYNPETDYADDLGKNAAAAVTAWLAKRHVSAMGRIEFTLTGYSFLPGRTSQPLLSVGRFSAALGVLARLDPVV